VVEKPKKAFRSLRALEDQIVIEKKETVLPKTEATTNTQNQADYTEEGILSLEVVQGYINEFVENIEKDSDKTALLSLKRISGKTLFFEFPANVFLEKFNDNRIELMHFIVEKTEIEHWQIETALVEVVQNEKLYKSQDIYNLFVEKNPLIETLKDKLGLKIS
jgi:hypothetical protein